MACHVMAWDVTPSRLASACARVIEAGDTDADDIKLALPEIAAAYAGVTGNCSLDSNGDRNTAVYGIYRFTSPGDRVYAKKIDEVAPVLAEVSEKGSVHKVT